MKFGKNIKIVVSVLIAAVLCMVSCIYASNDAKAAVSFEGSGSAEDPYLIREAEDLVRLSERVNYEGATFENQYFSLVNDIDMSGISFTPIGVYGSEKYFFGTLDGNGNAIKNLFVDIPGSPNGLFGSLGGTVVNLEIDGGTISGGCCGVISAHSADSKALILNCLTKNVTVNSNRAGGIVDDFGGKVVNCVSYNCILNGAVSFGGISSYAINGDSYGNYYMLKTDDAAITGDKVDVDGSSEMKASDDWQDVSNRLNSNYKDHPVFPDSDYGISNEWTVSESQGIEISNIKQRDIFRSNIDKLSGTGSFEKPYIINTADELCMFRDAVNSGYDFYGEYVSQAADIDLSGKMWIPIGQYGSEHYFYGFYDGKGHTLQNISTVKTGNNGFFGMLGGTVANLGIESGTVEGNNCGGITSHAAVSTAMIVNCYNKAKVSSTSRAGGIADNFSGSIIGCWSDCELEGKTFGGIASYNGRVIKYCATSYDVIVPEDTMSGEMTDCSSSVLLAGDKVSEMVDWLGSKMEDVKKLSGVRGDLYPFVVSDGVIRFSKSPKTFNLGKWISEHTLLGISILLLVLVYACLLLGVGPKKLYLDDRKWWKRFLFAFAPVFLFFYMFLIHSPIEFYIVNISEFGFKLGDFAPKYVVLAVILSVSVSAILAFIQGVICDIIACAVFGLDLCMYAQLNFMNNSLGLLDGNEKAVNLTGNYANAVIWLVIFLLPFVLFFAFKKYRTKVITAVCSVLCVMQLASIIALIVQSPKNAFEHDDTSQYYLVSDDQFTVSGKDNIIILVLDAFSNSYIGDLFENYPETESVVKDFTYYNNADCHYEGSVFSINYIASGTEWDPSVRINDWCKTAWEKERNNNFYSRLADQGYIFNVFSDQITALSAKAKHDTVGKISNMLQIDCNYEIDDEIMLNLFIRSSEYRFAPMLLKKQLEFVAGDYSGAYRVQSKGQGAANTQIVQDNSAFYTDLISKRLRADSSKNYYILYHLAGVHSPYTTNEKCEKVEESTLLQTERGCWVIVEEYLNQMKELGVYDNATIIITADHGAHHSYMNAQPIFFLKSPHETHNHYAETNAPISFTDIMPTVMYFAGGRYDDLGTTVFEHKEDEQRERELFVRMYDEELPDVPKRDSPVSSILNCFYKYVYTGDREDLEALGKNGPTEKLLWTDSFY